MANPSLPFDVQRPRTLPQLRPPIPGNNGRYTHLAMMIPSLYERYAAYLRRTRPVTVPLSTVFRPHEAVEIQFRPLPNQAAVTYEQSRVSLLDTLTSEYGIPLDQPGTVTIEFGISSDDVQGYRLLGGNSVIQVSFDQLQSLNYGDVLELLNERGYANVSVDMLHFTFRFGLIRLMEQASGGGCAMYYDTCLPPWQPPLHLYDEYTAGQKVAFGKVYIEAAPKHLQKVRGLWLLGDKYTESRWIEPVCGLMAFEYGFHQALQRQGRPHRCEEYYRDPGLLYNQAVACMSEHGVRCPAINATFTYLIDTVYPEYAVFVYDYRLLPLYHHYGALYLHHAREPYRRGQLTREQWERNMQFRIFIFLDLEKQHYFPIFNLRLFFNPYRLPTVQVKRTAAGGEQQQPQRTSGQLRADHVRLPCPHCHHRVRHTLLTHE